MNTQTTRNQTHKLSEILSGMARGYEELEALLAEKFEAMRAADVTRMQELSHQEKALVENIRLSEQQRRSVLEQLGKELETPPRAARNRSVEDWAVRLSAADRSPVRDAARRLRDAVYRTARANRVAGEVGRTILDHLRWISEAIKPKSPDGTGYGPEGAASDLRPEVSGARPRGRLFEAVG
jgi:flagellar biosynthesis/type III secretory pathway chaperone